METNTTTKPQSTEEWSDMAAHWTVRGHRNVMLNVRRNGDGSVTGTVPGHNNGFTSSPDRDITFTAADVRRLRMRISHR